MFRKFAALYALVRQDVRTLWHALRHPARPAWLRPAVALVALYLISWMVRLLPEALKRRPPSPSRTLARKA